MNNVNQIDGLDRRITKLSDVIYKSKIKISLDKFLTKDSSGQKKIDG